MKKMYIGPTIDGIAIHNAVYEELPPPLEAAIKRKPYLAGLCIPVSELSKAMKQIASKSGAAYKFYNMALKDRAEIAKGAE